MFSSIAHKTKFWSFTRKRFCVVCALNCARILVVRALDCAQFICTLPVSQPSWNTATSSGRWSRNIKRERQQMNVKLSKCRYHWDQQTPSQLQHVHWRKTMWENNFLTDSVQRNYWIDYNYINRLHCLFEEQDYQILLMSCVANKKCALIGKEDFFPTSNAPLVPSEQPTSPCEGRLPYLQQGNQDSSKSNYYCLNHQATSLRQVTWAHRAMSPPRPTTHSRTPS